MRDPVWLSNGSELHRNVHLLASEMALEKSLTLDEIRQGIAEHGPWFYRFQFPGGLETVPSIPTSVEGIFGTRLEMVNRAVRNHFGARLPQIECLDVGCHEGFYSLALAGLGAKRVVGVDVRPENLARARFVAAAMDARNVAYREGRVESLATDIGETFDLTLFLGVLYHVEDPMRCLRQVAAVTKEMCVIETQVIDEITGFTEWGSREWTRPYRGVIAVIDEANEFEAGIRETGVSSMATCPSPEALRYMLSCAGFRHIEPIEPPPDAYEQHARGRRVVWAARK
jgi:ubiquinone/menaquinone biosynthesis C-methylase UbiE